jgi:hypothetical protein
MGLVNIQNTNLENGVTNRNAADLFGSMAQLDPTRFHSYMEDFDYFTAADWTLVSTGSTALQALDGGVLRLVTGAVATNEESLIKAVGSFEILASIPTYFRAKIEVDEATECNINVGLADSAALAPNNCIQFRKDTGDLDLDVLVRSASADVDVDTAVTQIANATSFTVEFYWDGIDRVYYGANGTPLGFLDAATLPAGVLSPTLSVFAGAAGAVTLDLDYLMAATERS